MIKRAWLIPVVSLTIAMASSAAVYAEGWQKSGNDWVYVDSNNNKIYNEWRKGADDKWRWINSNGVMAVNSWVDSDNYYVDANGVMLENAWKQIEDKWYYFGNKGKLTTSSWKKIDNKWYYLNDEGHMATGWILDDMYYCGEDGVMRTGWQKLYPVDSEEREHSGPATGSGDDDDKKWFYFSTSGKKYVPDGSSERGERKIDGKKYCFNDKGELQTGWVNIESYGDVDAHIKDFRYYNADGTIRTGWYSIEPPEDLESRYDDEVEWFYFSSTGVPRASENDSYKSSDIYKINGKSYLFDENGNPLYGLQKVYISGDKYTSYYFGTSSQCHTQKGKQNVEEGSGEKVQYYFQESSGRGYTGVKDSYLYYMGRVQKAEGGTKYQVISIPSNEAGSSFTNYVVTSAGKIVKGSSVKDADKVKYTTNSAGILTKIDDSTDGIKGSFEAPTEPIFADNN